MAGGDQAVTAAIVVVTVGAIVAARVPATVRAIEQDKATQTNETCTAISVTRHDLHRKVRYEIPRDQLPAVQDRTTSLQTRVATFIAEMIRADGNKGRKAAGKAATGSPGISSRNRLNKLNNGTRRHKTSGQLASLHRNRVLATMLQGISS